uniref:Peptidase A2 domain-containing protein n=1 Tax=Strongyloides venezuelensis TaxID=75913 RepID=A0A0K0G3I8_STRVS
MSVTSAKNSLRNFSVRTDLEHLMKDVQTFYTHFKTAYLNRTEVEALKHLQLLCLRNDTIWRSLEDYRYKIHPHGKHINADCLAQHNQEKRDKITTTKKELNMSFSSFTKKNTGLIVKLTFIENMKVLGLIDNGANIIILSKSLTLHLDLAGSENKREIFCTGKDRRMSEIMQPIKITLSGNTHTFHDRVYISDIDFENYDIILGMPALIQLNITINTQTYDIESKNKLQLYSNYTLEQSTKNNHIETF